MGKENFYLPFFVIMGVLAYVLGRSQIVAQFSQYGLGFSDAIVATTIFFAVYFGYVAPFLRDLKIVKNFVKKTTEETKKDREKVKK